MQEKAWVWWALGHNPDLSEQQMKPRLPWEPECPPGDTAHSACSMGVLKGRNIHSPGIISSLSPHFITNRFWIFSHTGDQSFSLEGSFFRLTKVDEGPILTD